MNRSTMSWLRRTGRAITSWGSPQNGLGRRDRQRFRVFTALVFVWFAIVSVRLFDLQVFRVEELRDRAIRQHETTVDLIAKRGAILDRHGNELALSTSHAVHRRLFGQDGRQGRTGAHAGRGRGRRTNWCCASGWSAAASSG